MGDNGHEWCPQTTNINLVRFVFSIRPLSSSPQLDINLTFSCNLRYSNWEIRNEQDSGEEILVLVDQIDDSLADRTVCLSVQQFLCYDQTHEALDVAFRDLNLEDVERDNVIEYAWVKVFDEVKLKPAECDVMDLHFSLLVENQLILNQESENLDESAMVPAPESSIQSLTIVDSAGAQTNCSICLEDYLADHTRSSCGDDQVLLSMPCYHVFHRNCITKWLRTSHYCPICRFQMPTTSSDE